MDEFIKCLKRQLETINFFPLTRQKTSIVKECFERSKIISTLDQQLLQDALEVLPGITSSKLLFRHTDNKLVDPNTRHVSNCTTAELFHQQCDNKGPTITLVQANQGYIFGAYSPVSWISSFCYTEAQSAFIFCLRRPRGIPDQEGQLTLHPPFACRVKPQCGGQAIKQSETEYSPGFGETNKCDLLLSYKDLEDSYCRVGNIYEVPWQFKHLPEVEQWSIIAGRATAWDVKEIEVYAVN